MQHLERELAQLDLLPVTQLFVLKVNFGGGAGIDGRARARR
jgi:hypothetical protein